MLHTALLLRADNQCCNIAVMKELIIKYKALYTGSSSYSMKNNCKIYTINDEFMQVHIFSGFTDNWLILASWDYLGRNN